MKQFIAVVALLLTFSSLYAQGDDNTYPKVPTPCTKVDLTVHVVNIGSTCDNNPSFTLAVCNSFYCDFPAGTEIQIWWEHCDVVPGGGRYDISTFTVTAPAIPAATCVLVHGNLPSSSLCGEATLTAVVDPNNQIQETNESNNMTQETAPGC